MTATEDDDRPITAADIAHMTTQAQAMGQLAMAAEALIYAQKMLDAAVDMARLAGVDQTTMLRVLDETRLRQ